MFLATKLNTGGSLGGYQISRSLRFNSADSAYLNRTPASAGNQKTWTLSFWVKRANLGGSAEQMMYSANNGSGTDSLYFNYAADDSISIYLWNATSGYLVFIGRTTAVFRDPSAWYHIVLAVDTTQATGTDRVKFYVNNVLQTISTYTAPAQNSNCSTNSTGAHYLGRFGTSALYYLNGYMTEVNFIDGSQLTPSSFGETNAQTGVWQPKAYSGSYGTNGFYLNFSDNSNTTAATLGKDYSGNGNNWTPNNFSVSAGSGNDSLVDSPTSYGTDTGAGGTVRGNYATLNPVDNGGLTLANGNLDFTNGGTNYIVRATIAPTSGKYYWEVVANGESVIGVVSSAQNVTSSSFAGLAANALGYYGNNGQVYQNGSVIASFASFTSTDVIGFALDVDALTCAVYKNNTLQGTITGLLNPVPAVSRANAVGTCNFGQRPFAYTAPSGYKALCTQNLPTPTIGATTATQAGKFFNPVIWTGNGSTQTISGVGFQPDFTWAKCRSTGSTANILQDVIRGAGSTLFSEDTSAQLGNSGDLITSWNSDGFGVNRNFLGGTTNNSTNGSGQTYVAWNWKANGSGSTNTAGSITSTVSANTTSGFSIALGTTPSSGSATYGHGLGVAPSFIFAKSTAATSDWFAYHTSLGFNQDIRLNTSSAVSSTTFTYNSANSSTVTIGGSSVAAYWGGNAPWIWYNFAEVAGYSKFGSYTGNGSADGPFVFTNMRPAFLMIKRTDTAGYPWVILDNKRNTYNPENLELYPNSSSAEASGGSTYIEDFLSNGFKIRQTDGTWNASGGTYIFAAFAESPFKYSLAR